MLKNLWFNLLNMEALHQFDPNTTSQQVTFWVTVIIALSALGGLIFLLKKKSTGRNRNQNMLLAMLLFFAFLIAASTAFFSQWSNLKTGPVVLYPDRIETAYGTASFSNIKKAYLLDNRQPSIINPNINRKTVKMLVIEEANGQVHVLSEKHYPISEIFGRLKKAIDQWKENNKGQLN